MATLMEKDVLIEKIASLSARICKQKANEITANPDLEWLKKSRTLLLCSDPQSIQFDAWVSILNSIKQSYER